MARPAMCDQEQAPPAHCPKQEEEEPPAQVQSPRKTVILDVGGDRFTALRSCFATFPATRLSKLMRAKTIEKILELCDEFFPGDPPEYFFDRNPTNFPTILNIYRTGSFHMKEGGCAMVLQKDLDYWGIDDMTMEPCCALKYYPDIDQGQSEKDGEEEAKLKALEQAEEEDFGPSSLGIWRTWLWNTIEYPWTSNLAQFVAVFSLSMVLVSTVTFIISTADELQEDDHGNVDFPLVLHVIDMIDNFVIVYFTVEYIIRLIICPVKAKFVKDPMNLIDISAIMPFYLSLLLEGLEDFQIIGKTGKMIRLVRVMRILRIFKLVRHFAGLQSLFYTLQQAYQELGLLLLLVAVAILTYSSLVYFAERGQKDEDIGVNCTGWEKNVTIKNPTAHPCYRWTFIESFWWGLMTITTVGYDMNPKTLMGKLIGGFCALSGVFILTLPIPIVVNSFAIFYKNRLWRNEVEHKKREMTMQLAADEKAAKRALLFNNTPEDGGPEGRLESLQADDSKVSPAIMSLVGAGVAAGMCTATAMQDSVAKKCPNKMKTLHPPTTSQANRRKSILKWEPKTTNGSHV